MLIQYVKKFILDFYFMTHLFRRHTLILGGYYMNYNIVIDAGHGGDDGGASGNGIVEKDLTLKISELMYQKFKELGIPVTLVRNRDETVSPTERVNRILNAYGDNSNVIVLSNHINAGGRVIKIVMDEIYWCITS